MKNAFPAERVDFRDPERFLRSLMLSRESGPSPRASFLLLSLSSETPSQVYEASADAVQIWQYGRKHVFVYALRESFAFRGH